MSHVGGVDRLPTSRPVALPQSRPALCVPCPIRAECLDFALADGCLVGVWGGTSARERKTMRRSVA